MSRFFSVYDYFPANPQFSKGSVELALESVIVLVKCLIK